ncbi:hypothetical protein COCON_G00203840 [Conger conger]|uniref:SH3 and cysteine-rich domain-containing protein 2 n=1 Tax=Conger conger TaxID=82655 RepID=A0A9Q1CZV8_CONCO|nr:hypothetical protein COCON_G00203840 [Conger conger]
MTENSEKENEPQNQDLENSQSTVSIQPVSKLQRLKRSLSFKTIMRSRSVDNFFQSPNPSLCSRSPTLASSPALSSKLAPQARPVLTHCFLEHVFRRPTSCQQCKHAIVGNSKQGLRCKTCKMGAHLWCSSELSQQPCNGKTGIFKRNLSSPMLINDQLGAVKEAPPPKDAVRGRVDPVYETLRYGTSLAQMSRSSFGSLSESPTRSMGEGGEERREEEVQASPEEDSGLDAADVPVPVPAPAPAPETEAETEKVEPEDGLSSQKAPKRIEVHSVHTYVALYKFLPQEQNDLELQPGDRVQVTDDSNEEWWKGKSGDKVGFFPANFVQRVRPGERVWRVTQGSQGNRETGHMAVKESQICVGKSEDGNSFLKLSSGKKRGLVPCDSLEEI